VSADAITRGVAFLGGAQLASGEIPVETSTDPQMRCGGALDPSIFPTALAISCLTSIPAADQIVTKARRFLLAESSGHGLWRHWPRAHPHHRQLPPDVDDSACAAAALGPAAPDTRALLLANRRSDGLFLTWIIPRLRWAGVRHLRATLPQLRHLPTLAMFFRHTSAHPGDVDAVVNANALHFMGAFPGRERIVAHLKAVLRDGAEAHCDKWYEDPFVVWYFFARALNDEPDARTLIAERISEAPRMHALHAALAITTYRLCRLSPDPRDIAHVLNAQLPSGGWPRAAMYHGGRRRLRSGRFAPPHPHTPYWGSQPLTTAFALQALSPSRPEP
jgi:hypothetical protein